MDVWSVNSVVNWLENIGLRQFGDVFRRKC
ncbi:SAM domain-containing protein [Acinetobacter baumannii]